MKYDWTKYLRNDEPHRLRDLAAKIKNAKAFAASYQKERDQIRRTAVLRARYAATKAALSIRKEET